MSSSTCESKDPLTKRQKQRLFSRTVAQGHEGVFSIDHLLEKIFSHLDLHTLKNTRKVCERWMTTGTNEIQKRVRIILKYSQKPKDGAKNYELITCLLPSKVAKYNKETLIPRLIDIAKNSMNFPCSTFDVICYNLMEMQIQNLLSCIGTRITNLSLLIDLRSELTLQDDGIQSLVPSTFVFSKSITGLQNLLYNQVPNLKFFSIGLVVASSTNLDAMQNLDNDSTLHFFDSKDAIIPTLPGLKMIKVHNQFPPTIFRQIMNSAVNLEALYLCADATGTGPLMEYFVEDNEGRNRLHLLKHLDFFITDKSILVFEKLIRRHTEDLKIRLETLGVWKFLRKGQCRTLKDFWPRAGRVVTQILKSSRMTLKKLGMTPLGYMSGLTIPIMPKLKSLHLEETMHLRFRVSSLVVPVDNFFPHDFNMAKNFPIVQQITLDSLCHFDIQFYSRLHMSDPVVSVKQIRVARPKEILTSVRLKVSRMFPNAVICGWNA